MIRLFTKRKSNIVFPSELNSFWLDNKQKSLLDKPRLLYVGRVKVEKGIFDLLKIFNEIEINTQLSIVGRAESVRSNNKKVSFVGYISDSNKLIKSDDWIWVCDKEILDKAVGNFPDFTCAMKLLSMTSALLKMDTLISCACVYVLMKLKIRDLNI